MWNPKFVVHRFEFNRRHKIRMTLSKFEPRGVFASTFWKIESKADREPAFQFGSMKIIILRLDAAFTKTSTNDEYVSDPISMTRSINP